MNKGYVTHYVLKPKDNSPAQDFMPVTSTRSIPILNNLHDWELFIVDIEKVARPLRISMLC